VRGESEGEGEGEGEMCLASTVGGAQPGQLRQPQQHQGALQVMVARGLGRLAMRRGRGGGVVEQPWQQSGGPS
jgi:hypothetical protein